MGDDKNTWDYWAKEFDRNDVYSREWDGWDRVVDSFAAAAPIQSRLVYGRHNDRAVTSIFVPAYRRPEGLMRALDSALRQQFDYPFDVVVVDDSGERTEDYRPIDDLMRDVCTRHRNVVYYRNERNLGAGDNWNRTMELCQTPWCCMLHDDDELSANYLSEMYASVPEFERLGLALVAPYFRLNTDTTGGAQTVLTRAYGLLLGLRGRRPIVLGIHDALRSIFPNTVAMYIHRAKAMSVGGLNREWGVLGDSVFFAQLAMKYGTGIYPKELCVSNKVGGSASTSPLVANYSVVSYFRRTKAIASTLGKSEQQSLRLASESSVYAELALLNKQVDEINQVRTRLGARPWYNWAWYKQFLKVKKALLWGVRLVRR